MGEPASPGVLAGGFDTAGRTARRRHHDRRPRLRPPKTPQGAPYLLGEPSRELAEARLWRCPGADHAAEVGRRLLAYRSMQGWVQGSAASLLQAAWRRRAASRAQGAAVEATGGVPAA
jgi:hypothetical protein